MDCALAAAVAVSARPRPARVIRQSRFIVVEDGLDAVRFGPAAERWVSFSATNVVVRRTVATAPRRHCGARCQPLDTVFGDVKAAPVRKLATAPHLSRTSVG